MARDRRSRVVAVLKYALPAAALALAAAVFLASRDRSVEGFRISGVDFAEGGGLRMAEPQFSGRTPDGLPFRARADWALPDGPDPERVEFGPLTADATLADGRRLTLTASGGEAMPKAERLTLTGGVELRSVDGYALRVADAAVDGAAMTLEGSGPVEGLAPFGDLSAASMRAARRGESHYIWFEGGVRVRIDPEKARAQGD